MFRSRSKCNCELRNRVWKIVGSAAAAAVVAGVVFNFKSIRRYVRISMM
jgi:hypothetical protein